MVGSIHIGSIGLAHGRRHLQRFYKFYRETTNVGGLQTHYNGLSIFELGPLEGSESNYFLIPSLLLLCKTLSLWLSLAKVMFSINGRIVLRGQILSISLPFTWNIVYCNIQLVNVNSSFGSRNNLHLFFPGHYFHKDSNESNVKGKIKTSCLGVAFSFFYTQLVSNVVLVLKLSKFLRLVEIAIVMVVRSMEEERTFSMFSFMKSKLCNHLMTHFDLVFQIYMKKFYKLASSIEIFTFYTRIEDLGNEKLHYGEQQLGG